MHTTAQLRSGELAGIRRLNLSCGLTTFPPEIFDLADTLEILDLSGNGLSELPDDLARLHRLRAIFCTDNAFTHLPTALGDCPHLSVVGFKSNRIRSISPKALPGTLRWLTLTDNALDDLPQNIGACSDLQKLMLSGNRLRTLPETLARCERLELIRIAANQLGALPQWLLSLPRLAWLAYGGNPFVAGMETAALNGAAIADIPWCDLEIDRMLGQGASGVIHGGVLNRNGDTQAVAVKLFKGAMTSDGLPGSEMAAAVHAGIHPHLVGVIGRVTDHPSGQVGLVMPLIDASFSNLAAPPSLETFTRDVYDAAATFRLEDVLRIARAAASAARHLHGQGLMHGDLYAHNVLWSRDHGQALIGDFGAATFCDRNDIATAQALERIEVRAFGCLLEELVARCDPSADAGALTSLRDLMARCLVGSGARPTFAALVDALDEIGASVTFPASAVCAC